MKVTDKKNQITGFLKGVLLFTLLGVVTGCSGGSTQSTSTGLSYSKVEVCDEVKGWEDGCKFVGMKLMKQDPEEITSLAEKYGRRRGGV